MYMNIRPRQKKDKGGWLCMPQCKNIPEGKKGWTKIKCPICGELCWKRPLQDEIIHKIKAEGACCTLCAMKMNMK